MTHKLATPLLLTAALLLSGCADSSSGTAESSVKNTAETTAATSSIAAEATTTVEDSVAVPDTTAAAEQKNDESSSDTEYSYPADEQKLVDDAYAVGYEHGYRQGMKDATVQTLWLTGDFTATVQKILPDYVSDPFTPRVAVITFFQSDPILVHMEPEFLQNLKEEETYTFVLKGQEIPCNSSIWSSDDDWADDQLLSGVRLELTEVRQPTENEYGLLCNRMHAVNNTNAAG